MEKIEKTFGINPIWLETGNSGMFIKDNTTADIDNIINWLKGLNAEKKIWIKHEMPDRFHEYK